MGVVNLGLFRLFRMPFVEKNVLLKLSNILKTRHKYVIRYSTNKELHSTHKLSLDEKFVLDLHKAIIANFENPEFGVEDLSKAMSIDRSQLYRKTISITGKKTVDIIREFRLNKAKDLLENKAANVSEAAYQCGFNDPKHFSKKFREFFNESPQDVLRNS